MRKQACVEVIAVVLLLGSWARGQSSSTFIVDPSVQQAGQGYNGGGGDDGDLSVAIRRASFLAVGTPAPRRYSKHDLVTIIIRESVTLDNEATLDTEKEYELDGKISAFPRLTLTDLLNLQLRPSAMSDGDPAVKLDMEKTFEGDGEQSQSNTFTARITARIIDIKPNGTLVLEARKQIQADDEAFRIVMTGTCRKEDITADNTILSTQLYDMSLVKETKGELRKATKKGLFAKVLDTIFAF